MQKMQVVFDEAKIDREQRFSSAKMQDAIDQVLVGRYGLVKQPDGFYLESGLKDDYVDFMSAILLLKEQPWFMDNVKSWLWFNSDDSPSPEDYAIEDIKAHYGNGRAAA